MFRARCWTVFAVEVVLIAGALGCGGIDEPGPPIPEPVAAQQPGITATPDLVRVAPPGDEAAVEVSSTFEPLPSGIVRRVCDVAQGVEPTAECQVYGRIAKDGSMGLVLLVRQEIGVEEEGRSLVEESGRLQHWIETQAGQDDELPVDVEIVPRPGQHTVEFLGTMGGTGGGWVRGQLWATADGVLRTRACACMMRGCESVRASCELAPVVNALPVDAPLPRPVQQLAVGNVQLEIPRVYEPIAADELAALAREQAANVDLIELHVVGAVSPAFDGKRGAAFAQRGRWCGPQSSSCGVPAIMDGLEASARAHAARDGLSIEVTRSRSTEGIEILLGDGRWERRRFVAESAEVIERACLCSGAACPYVKRSCSVEPVDAKTVTPRRPAEE